jgi:hypothetical protein
MPELKDKPLRWTIINMAYLYQKDPPIRRHAIKPTYVRMLSESTHDFRYAQHYPLSPLATGPSTIKSIDVFLPIAMPVPFRSEYMHASRTTIPNGLPPHVPLSRLALEHTPLSVCDDQCRARPLAIRRNDGADN